MSFSARTALALRVAVGVASTACFFGACGRLLYKPIDTAAVDASEPADARTIDATEPADARTVDATSARHCRWDAPLFRNVTLIPRSGSLGDTVVSPTLDATGLALSFIADGSAYTMRRPSIDAPFGLESLETDFSSLRAQLTAEFTRRDGLEQFLALDRDGTGPEFSDLFVRTRTSRSDPWSAPTPLNMVNTTEFQEWDPWLADDGLTLWFQREQLASADIFRAYRATRDGTFGGVMPVPSLSGTPAQEGSPSLPASGEAVVFSAEGQLWFSRLVGGEPEARVALSELDAVGVLDFEPVIRADGCEIFWVRDVGGRYQVHHAIRDPD